MPEFLQTWMIRSLIPIVTPLIIAGLKKAAEQLGTKLPKPLIPVAAAVIGAMLDLLENLTDIPGVASGLDGPLLGLAGVGVREVYDQIKKIGSR